MEGYEDDYEDSSSNPPSQLGDTMSSEQSQSSTDASAAASKAKKSPSKKKKKSDKKKAAQEDYTDDYEDDFAFDEKGDDEDAGQKTEAPASPPRNQVTSGDEAIATVTEQTVLSPPAPEAEKAGEPSNEGPKTLVNSPQKRDAIEEDPTPRLQCASPPGALLANTAPASDDVDEGSTSASPPSMPPRTQTRTRTPTGVCEASPAAAPTSSPQTAAPARNANEEESQDEKETSSKSIKGGAAPSSSSSRGGVKPTPRGDKAADHRVLRFEDEPSSAGENNKDTTTTTTISAGAADRDGTTGSVDHHATTAQQDEQDGASAAPSASDRNEAALNSSKTEGMYDLQVGLMRELWPKELSSIVCVDTNVIVRYSKALRKLDLVAISPDPSSKESTAGASKNPPPPSLQPAHSIKIPGAGGGPAGAGVPTTPAFATVRDSYWLVEFPRIVSIHHFSARFGGAMGNAVSSCIFCLMEDLKRFLIFRIDNNAKLEQITAASLPIPSSNLVVFAYREQPYLLSYQRASGDYIVSSLVALSMSRVGTSSIAARGTFRAGWTDIVWKGTHHVRCTRQKFFCYNSESGETIFECVWVRGGSATSSVCSQEHVQMATTGKYASSNKLRSLRSTVTEESSSQFTLDPSTAGPDGRVAMEDEAELRTVLRRKSCFIVPITVAGKTSCLLYHHSDFNKKKFSRDRSTSKIALGNLLDASGHGMDSAIQAMLPSSIVESTSLMLTKKVFAHADPWTNFCMVEDVSIGGAPARLLCYSSNSGIVWVNAIFASQQPEKVVTIVQEQQVSVSSVLNAAASEGNYQQHSGGQSPGRGAGRSGGGGGAGGRRSPNGLTTHALRSVDHASPARGVEDYTEEQRRQLGLRHGGGGGGRSPSRSPAPDFITSGSLRHIQEQQHGGGSRHPDGAYPPGKGGQPHSSVRVPYSPTSSSNRARGAGGDHPPLEDPDGTQQRPTTGGSRLFTRPASSSDRLHQRLSSLPPPTGNLPLDLRNVIQVVQQKDFYGAPACTRLAMEELDAGSASGGGGVAGRGSSASGSASGGSPRVPWRPVIGCEYFVPFSPNSLLQKFETEYQDLLVKRCDEAKKSRKAGEPVKELRPDFYQPTSHEKLRLSTLAMLDAGAHINSIGKNVDPKSVAKTLEKLSVMDVELRRKRVKDQDLFKEKEFQAELERSRIFTESRIEDQIDRLYHDGVHHHEVALKKLAEQYRPLIPNSPPVSLIHNASPTRPSSGRPPANRSPTRKTIPLDASDSGAAGRLVVKSATHPPPLPSFQFQSITITKEMLSPHRPLSATEEKALGDRLGQACVQHRQVNLQRIKQEMDAHIPSPPKMPAAELIKEGMRLHKNEKRK